MNFEVEKISHFEIEGKKGLVVIAENEYPINDTQYSQILKELVATGLSKQFKQTTVTKGSYKKIWDKISN